MGTPVASRDGVDPLYLRFSDTRFGGSFVSGELRNRADRLLRAPIVLVTLTDSARQTVATVDPDPLSAGKAAPFELNAPIDVEPG